MLELSFTDDFCRTSHVVAVQVDMLGCQKDKSIEQPYLIYTYQVPGTTLSKYNDSLYIIV